MSMTSVLSSHNSDRFISLAHEVNRKTGREMGVKTNTPFLYLVILEMDFDGVWGKENYSRDGSLIVA